MSAVHLHLVLNHLPVLGVVFAGILFVVARIQRSAAFQRIALWFLVGSALAAIPVYLTGEPAEEVVEGLPGMAEALIERHEEAAGAAFAAMEIVGGLALLAALVFREARAMPGALAAGLIALVLGTGGLFAWTGYLGGQIRHSEVRTASLSGETGGGDAGETRGAERDDD